MTAPPSPGDPIHPPQWERLGLEATLLHPTPSLQDLARAYLDLSEHHHRRPSTTGALTPGTPDPPLHHLVRWLVFARRTYVILRALRPFLRPTTAIVEHGAGLAPGLHALASSASRTAALEHQPGYTPLRNRLFALRGLSPPTTTPLPHPGPSTQLFPFSLAEIARRDPKLAAQHVQPFLERGEGPVVVLEAGDRDHGHFIQALRDHLRAAGWSPVHPCPLGPRSCPKTSRPHDWCHFTQSHLPSPLELRLQAAAGRKPHHHHYAALIYDPAQPPSTAPVVLGHLRAEKRKHTVELCAPDGVLRVAALRRHPRPFESLTTLRPGTRVQRPTEVDLKGDGLRLRPEATLSVERAPTVDCEEDGEASR